MYAFKVPFELPKVQYVQAQDTNVFFTSKHTPTLHHTLLVPYSFDRFSRQHKQRHTLAVLSPPLSRCRDHREGWGRQRGGRRRVIIPFEGGAKGEAKKADEAFEAHIDMWLCRLLCAQVRTNELCGRLILSGACRFPPVAVW